MQLLFEWFIGLRYSIDWTKYNKDCRSRGDHKSIGRFPRSLLRSKVKQFLADYLHASLAAGVPAVGFSPNARWFAEWQCDYGLTMLQPNRKFKVARHVQDERVTLWWISVYRIRALCLEIHGYEPEMENFDQSPYHDNEQGSQNGKTLAIKASGTCPLIEGHADTRQRWTGNFTTFSEKARILSGDLPYV